MGAGPDASAGGKGTESWFLLEGLVPGQRYEVRVCWVATVCSNLINPLLHFALGGVG